MQAIRWRMYLPVPIERVFAALDSDAGRAAFWAESAVETAEGIFFKFANGQTCLCPILERQAPRLLTLAYLGGVARFELEATALGGTDLMVTQEGVAAAEWHEVHAGWLNVLFPLKAWLVFGVDLRNHDPNRTWDHGYADG